MQAIVTGATGFVGKRLITRLQQPLVLSRDAQRARKALNLPPDHVFDWDPIDQPPPHAAFDGVRTVFHLAGEPVAQGRWTRAKKMRLRESRVLGTRHLVETLAQLDHKPSCLVSASAVGVYGSCGDEVLRESAPPQNDFLAEICVAWEEEANRARELGIRVVTVRVGIVLGPGGGALSKMLTPFRLGLGSPLGNGLQWMPWIHLDDLVAMLLIAADTAELSGPMNGTAPNPVTNRDFTRVLGKVLGRPTWMPAVPGAVLRVMLGEFGSVLLTSQRALPQAALDAGFTFENPDLEMALRDICS